MSAVRTTCAYCGVGCGVIVAQPSDEGVRIAGDPDHPSSFGRLCSKGAALAETLGLEGRLLHPIVDGARASWDAALDRVARGFADVIARRGPDAVAFYVSGQLLTEDYYVANKLMKGFIGGANIDTNSRLCMASSVAGHVRAFGEDIVPTCYEDLELADLIVLVGSNASWCHPVLFQRIVAAKEQDPTKKLVVIDPRRTATCEAADLHLPLRPGTDAILWNGLLHWLSSNGFVDYAFLEEKTRGFGEALGAARASREGIAKVAAACGLVPDDVARFFEHFARTERTVTCYSQGIHQSTSGTDKVNAILNCHLLTGKLYRPGAGPLSLTGQPNAMGGREVGGLASTLAAHMGFEHAERVARFWGSDRVARAPGLKAVEMFEAIGDGRIEAVWIACTNPAVSLPNADRVRDALARCPLVVVSDCTAETDTARLAHVLLPATTWGEKSGTVTSSERRISRQRAFLDAPGEARPDHWIFREVARRMGHGAGFDHLSSPAAIFREHAALSAFENDGERAFDLGGLADLSDGAYDTLSPIQWPVPRGAREGTARLERAYTPDGRACFIPVVPRGPRYVPDVEFPHVLNTGRVRDHWHTMTRTGRSPRLGAHVRQPFVEMHPEDAAALGLAEGSLARLVSPWGSMIGRVMLHEGQRRGSVFVPIHWSGESSSHGRVGALTHPETDPVSGQPELKHTPVRVERYVPAHRGALYARRPRTLPSIVDFWVRTVDRGFVQYDVAIESGPPPGRRDLIGAGEREPILEMTDEARGRHRAALVGADGRLEACSFIASIGSERGSHDPPPEPHWLAPLFEDRPLASAERMALLAGRPPGARTEDPGPIVCACHGVGRHSIVRAIRQQGLATPEALGAALGAGTQCGSCVPELRALLETERAEFFERGDAETSSRRS